VKSVVLKGGGEPLCYPAIDAVLQRASGAGLEVGLITNGELLSAHAAAIRKHCSWVRVSLDAASPETHRVVHRPAQAQAFEHAVQGIQMLTPDVFLGVVFVVGAPNAGELYAAARLAKSLGVQYIAFREQLGRHRREGKPPEWLGSAAEQFRRAYDDFHGSAFRVFGSGGAKGEFPAPKPVPYDLCNGPRLVGVLCANGRLYPCCALRFNSEYCFGAVTERSFREVWDGPERREVLRKISGKSCRQVCVGLTTYLRYDHYNRLFQYLVGPAGHTQFL